MKPKFCRGELCSKNQHITISFGLNLITSSLTLTSLCFECWDYTTYTHNGLINTTCQSQFSCRTENETSLPRYKYLTDSNAVVSCSGNNVQNGDHMVMLWDMMSANCSESNLFTNASIFLPEKAGVWKLCRDIDEDSKIWKVIRMWCPKIPRCLEYMGDLQKYCCKGICPFKQQAIREMDEIGHTTREAIHTAISSAIVTVILQILSYIEVVISWVSHYVTITRMTGITVLLSGVFLAFALTMNHYKVILMNETPRSLPYLPVEMGREREVTVGWCMWVGWVAVGFSIIACIAWLQFSRYLVSVANKGEIEEARKKRRESARISRPKSRPKSEALRALSAAPRKIAFRAKGKLMGNGRKSSHPPRSVSVVSYSHMENGYISGEDHVPNIQVQEM